MTAPTPAQRRQERLTSAFRAAETDGSKFAVIGRLAALLILAIWQAAISRALLYFYDALIALSAVSSLLQAAVSRMDCRWRVLLFAFELVGAALMTTALVFPNPLANEARRSRCSTISLIESNRNRAHRLGWALTSARQGNTVLQGQPPSANSFIPDSLHQRPLWLHDPIGMSRSVRKLR
jgi:hypothetical protein